MKGKYPIEYFKNPNINKPVEEIWNDIDSYSGEFFEDEPDFHEQIDFYVPLPPLDYKNKIIKGIFYSQGCEYILKLFPKIKEIFFAGAYTMWSSYSWCDKADFYLTCYENKPREKWHKNKYQRKKDIKFIPLQDADFTNEYFFYPTFNTPKDIDVLIVATPFRLKNLPLIAQTIKYYKEKYNYDLKVTFIFGKKEIQKNENGTFIYDKLPLFQKKELDKVFEILKDFKTVNYKSFVNYVELPKWYTRAKCTVLASLIEGKNRAIHESMSCDTPIVVFKDHNKYARGDYPIFYENSGEYAEEFSIESLAKTIRKVLQHPENYEPRKNHLKYSGRKNSINKLVSYLPYYKENIPDYEENAFHENQWIDLACVKDYQISYYDFLYYKNTSIAYAKGIRNIKKLLDFYYSRFGIR